MPRKLIDEELIPRKQRLHTLSDHQPLVQAFMLSDMEMSNRTMDRVHQPTRNSCNANAESAYTRVEERVSERVHCFSQPSSAAFRAPIVREEASKPLIQSPLRYQVSKGLSGSYPLLRQGVVLPSQAQVVFTANNANSHIKRPHFPYDSVRHGWLTVVMASLWNMRKAG